MKTRKENNKRLLKSVVLTGMIAGARPLTAGATNLFSYENLGSGSQLRSNLIEQYASPADAVSRSGENFTFEAKCGEGKCGEGKCGEKEGDKKKKEVKKEGTEKTTKAKVKAKTETKKKAEKGKTKEAKCGEGKCGEKK